MHERPAIQHYALIPAKAHSSRCPDKNWRRFIGKDNLVSYLISVIPEKFFEQVILSTDKHILRLPKNIIIHHRNKSLATQKSPINDLIALIINEYNLQKKNYLWLLNPTSPFRMQGDFFKIKKIISTKSPPSLISAAKVNPYIWRDSKPLFKTGYPRKNTQDFAVEYHVENGQFIIFRVGEFLKAKTLYSSSTYIYKQAGIKSLVDIDTDDDFLDAQILAGGKR